MNKALIAGLTAILAMHATAHASERGQVIRAGDLMAQPFIDAAKLTSLTAKQPVTIMARQGAWAKVEAAGKNGWIRNLNLRLEQAALVASNQQAKNNGTNRLKTGSSGRTVTTGVKGLDEADIGKAKIDNRQLQLLGGLAVAEPEARTDAAAKQLKQSDLAYLSAGESK